MSLYIVRKKLTAKEVDVPDTRWNEECNCIQTTADGGATWTDNPGADPRINPAYQAPALTGEDIPCRAATGMQQRMKQIVDAFVYTGDIIAGSTAIFGLISLVFPPAAIVAAILAFVEFLVFIGQSEVETLMTEEVYDAIKCIFMCAVDGDGQLDEDAFAGVYDAFDAQLPEGASGIADRVLDILGFVGVNNAGALDVEEYDCDECDCGADIVLILEVEDDETFGTSLVYLGENRWRAASRNFGGADWLLMYATDTDARFYIEYSSIDVIAGDYPDCAICIAGGEWRSETAGEGRNFVHGYFGQPTYPFTIGGFGWGIDDGQSGAFTVEFTIVPVT